ncbi:UNVERIFIED_CONTAM: putative pyrroloquinoline-quinone binding quinoprotein [Acetivibrio alkalicellulosi]
MSDKFEYTIKNAILKGTDSATEQKDKVWENISKKLKENRDCDVMKKKKSVPYIPISIASVLVIIILLAYGLTEQGRDQFMKLKALFETESTDNELPNESKYVLIESDKGYVIYIDENHYKMLTGDTPDKIVPIDWKKSDDINSYAYMEIQHIKDKNTSEVLDSIKTQIKNVHNITVSEDKVDSPVAGWKLSFSTEYRQEVYYVIDNENNGSFLIKQLYSLDELESHGANFDNMLNSFAIISTKNTDNEKIDHNNTVDEVIGEEVTDNGTIDKNLRKDFVWNIGDFEVRDGNILSEVVSLRSSNPLRKISGDKDIFPNLNKVYAGYTRYIPIFIEESDTKIWATGEHKGFGYPSDTSIRIKIKDGKKVYSSTRFFNENEDHDVEITDLLLEVGINMSLAKVEIIHESNDRYTLVYKISDGTNEELYFTKLNYDKKTLKTIPLSRFNISYANNDVYILYENQKHYIALWSDKENKLLNFEIPIKLEKVEVAFKLYDNLYIKALKNNNITSYFKVNPTTKEITEYLTLKNLKDIYPVKWTFKSDLIENYYVKSIGDIIFVHGTDGRFSGYHDHCYLYGINKNTGKRIWGLYGYCVEYSISEDEKYIVGGNSQGGLIKCIEINTGKTIWSKSIEDYHFFSIVHHEDSVLVGNSESITALNAKTGEFLWKQPNNIESYLPANDRNEHDNDTDFNDKIIHEALSGEEYYSGVKIIFNEGKKIQAVNSRGDTLWEMDYNWFFATYNRYNFYHPIRVNNTLYINMNDAMVALDANTGQLLYQVADYITRISTIEHLGNEVYWFLNAEDGIFEALKIK